MQQQGNCQNIGLMFIYNTTFHIDRECYNDLVAWLRDVYIPVTVRHGALSEPRLARIIVDEKEKGENVALQFFVARLEDLSRWYSAHGDALSQELRDKFGRRVVGFSTIMEHIEV